MSPVRQNLLLILAVLALVAWPLAVRQGGQADDTVFEGTDAQAVEVVRQLAPDYLPWAEPLFVPPSGEIETLFFTLQGVLGAGFIGYYFGRRHLRSRRQRSPEGAV